MAIKELTANLGIISALDDEPNDVDGLSAAELKAKFDAGGELIKTFLNESLIPDVTAEIRNEVSAAVVAGGNMPLGGGAGDMLIKRSSTDFDAEFVPTTSVITTQNLILTQDTSQALGFDTEISTDGALAAVAPALIRGGDCDTPAAESEKQCCISGYSALTHRPGALVRVSFAETNTASAVTLNVSETGAMPVYANGTAMALAPMLWRGNSYIFMHGGDHWSLLNPTAGTPSVYGSIPYIQTPTVQSIALGFKPNALFITTQDTASQTHSPKFLTPLPLGTEFNFKIGGTTADMRTIWLSATETGFTIRQNSGNVNYTHALNYIAYA